MHGKEEIAARALAAKLAILEAAALVQTSRELLAGSRRLLDRAAAGMQDVNVLRDRTRDLYQRSVGLLRGENRPDPHAGALTLRAYISGTPNAPHVTGG